MRKLALGVIWLLATSPMTVAVQADARARSADIEPATVLATPSSSAPIPAAERQALIDFYNSAQGATWFNSTGWLGAEGTECTWYGIVCGGSGGHVTEINLPNNNLKGTIADLTALGSLSKLALTNNRGMTLAPVPAWISTKTSLTFLGLGQTRRNGSFPDLSALTNLQTLSLASNPFTSGPISSWLASLTSLTYLNLGSTNRTGAIPDLSTLTGLQTLALSANPGLTPGAVPDWVGGLPNLSIFLMQSCNRMGSLPAWLATKTTLTQLDLYGNQLSGSIPPWIGNLTNLTYLNLSYNQLTGPIPSEIGNLVNLTRMDLDGNQLTGTLPASLGNLTQIQTLYLEHNPGLTGAIPAPMGGMAALQNLFLGYTGISGPIPASFANLTEMRQLRIESAALTGDIPNLSGLTNLQELYLGSNAGLSPGPVPTWLGGLASLRLINLSFTNRTGDIPNLAALASLQTLDLTGNQQMAAGPVPAWLAGNPNLIDIELGYTNRTGDIPDMSGATGLQVLDLSGNPGMSAGPIPTWLAGMTSLTRLALVRRTGDIPDLSAAANLESFGLEDSPGLTPGPIPAWLAGKTTLRSLELWNTNRTGDIPDLSGNNHLGTLVIKDNPGMTPGPIPAWVTALQPDDTLALSFGGTNRTGAIPDLSTLPLAVLDLSDNPHLDAGPIPDWITGESGLIFLWLANSDRTGTVPSGLGNLTNLIGLTLASNRLTGPLPASLTNLTHLGETIPELLIDPSVLITDLRWNAVHTTDPTLRAFLDSKQTGGDWESTQTVAPTGVSAGTPTETSLRVSLTPIAYTGDFGGYRVSYATDTGGPYTTFGTTASKTDSSLTVTGLAPGTPYYFRVETITTPHAHNPNTVISEPSAPATGTTSAPQPNLAIAAVSWPEPVNAGAGLTYTLTVTNLGSVAATGATVTDTLPAGVSFVSASSSQGSCSGGAIVTCALGTLSGGANATVLVVGRPASAGTLVNTPAVAMNETDPDPTDNTAVVTSTVVTKVEPLPGVNLWTSMGLDGAAVFDIKVDPLATSTVWTTTYGGVFKTTDGGGHWARMSRSSALAVAPHPTNAGEVLIADRDRQIFKSTDGGATWSPSGTGIPALTSTAVWATLRYTPGDPTVVYFARPDSLYMSADGGTTWGSIATGPLAGTTFRDLVIDPATPTTVYVSLANTTPCAVYKSTDAGSTWAPACAGLPVDGSGNMGVRALALDPANPEVLFASSVAGGRLWASSDGGTSWTLRCNEPHNFARLVARPGSAGVLYGTATDSLGDTPTYRQIIYRSDDGGVSWSKLTAAYLDAVPSGTDGLAIDPAHPDVVYANLQEGIYRSGDGGTTWDPASGGLRGIDFTYPPAFDPTTPATWYIHGSANGIFKTLDGGTTFFPINAGLIDPTNGTMLVDPANPQVVYSAGETKDDWERPGEVYGLLVKSIDGGTTWGPVTNVEWPGSGAINLQAWGLVALPTTPATIFAAGPCDGVFRSTDGGSTFHAVNDGLIFDSNFPCQPWTQDLVSADAAGSTLYLATYHGLFASTTWGALWYPSDAGMPAGTDVRSVAVDPTNPLKVFAGTRTGVYASTDGGWSWTPSGSGMPSGTVYWVVIDPTDPSVLYATWRSGTDVGVYRSGDGGATWSVLANNAGLDPVLVWRVAIDPADHNHLIASARGGLYQITVDTSDTDSDGVSAPVEAQVPSLTGGGTGDGNGDGTADAEQPNVTSLPTAEGDWATLVAPDGTALSGVSELTGLPPTGTASATGTESATGTAPLFAYTLTGLAPGGATTLTLYLPKDETITTYKSFGPTADNLAPHWYSFDFDGTTGAEIFQDATRTRIVLHLVDGGRGDSDLVANGAVSGPRAPAPVKGDANGDWTLNVGDVFYIINHLFAGGPPPAGPADVNGDGTLNVLDVFYLINHLFAGGPAPR